MWTKHVLETLMIPPAGTVFEAPEGRQPERDRLGELAFRAISYTPWPLEAGEEEKGELQITMG